MCSSMHLCVPVATEMTSIENPSFNRELLTIKGASTNESYIYTIGIQYKIYKPSILFSNDH